MSDRGTRSQIARTQWLRRLASRRRDVVAFVLSGGGPLGALQVGALKAMFDHGLAPDLLVGTSVGALNAAFIAFDPSRTGAARLESTWRGLVAGDLWPTSRLRAPWTRFLLKGDRVFDNTGIVKLIQSRLGDVTFEDARIPLGVVTADLETGTERIFTSGEITSPLLASTALPGIYPPVSIEGRLYIDGGVANNVPVAPAVEFGAKTIYVLDTTAHKSSRRALLRPLDHLMHAFALARANRFYVEMPWLQKKARVVVVPIPQLDFHVPLASVEHTARLIDMAYAEADAYFSGPGAVGVPAPAGDVVPLT
jgi:NTE family protein